MATTGLDDARNEEADMTDYLALRRGAIIRVAEGDARLAEVVGRHLDVHAVTHADADEMLAHLAGNVGEDFVAIR